MTKHLLKNGQILNIRLGKPQDAEKYIDYVNRVAGESDNLTFGKGEFHTNIEQQKQLLMNFCVPVMSCF